MSQEPQPESFGRYLRFAVPLIVVIAGVSLGITKVMTPDQPLGIWVLVICLGAPFPLYFVLSDQNTVEGCVVLGMFLVLIVLMAKTMPKNIVVAITAVWLLAWLATRIHRRYCNGRDWIE